METCRYIPGDSGGGSIPSVASIYISRDGAVVARKAHNLEAVGSIPTPATTCGEVK